MKRKGFHFSDTFGCADCLQPALLQDNELVKDYVPVLLEQLQAMDAAVPKRNAAKSRQAQDCENC